MVKVHIIGSYNSLGTLFEPKTFGMHTNFYGITWDIGTNIGMFYLRF
jgi:hypothetical protein